MANNRNTSRWSLKFKLAFLFGLFSVISCLVVATGLSLSAKNSIMKQQEKSLSAIRDTKIEALQILFDRFSEDTESISETKYFQDSLVAVESIVNGMGMDQTADTNLSSSEYYKPLSAKYAEVFKEYLQQYGVNDFFAVLNTGLIVTQGKSNNLVGYHVLNEKSKGSSFKKCFEGAKATPKKTFFQDVSVLTEGQSPTVLACRTISSKYERDGYEKEGTMGVVMVELKWDRAYDLIKNIDSLVTNSQMYIIGSDGNVRVGKDLLKPKKSEVASLASVFKNGAAPVAENESGQKVMAAMKQFNFHGLNWSVILELPIKDILSDVYSLWILTFFIGLSISVILAFAGYLVADSIAKSLTADTVLLDQKAIELTHMSGALSEASYVLASSSSEQAASLEESVTILEEISSIVRQNSANTTTAAQESDNSRKGIDSGKVEMTTLVAAMHEMESSSKKIEEIIGVIEDIAFQTNLLALNAAVEAARAGDQGKGFAVVADAVRSLAQKSTVAAKDIADLIHHSVSSIQKGVALVENNNAILSAVFESVTNVAEMNSQVAISIKEQAQGIDQISLGMNQLDTSAQTNAATSEQLSSSAVNLEAAAKDLRMLVANLKGTVLGEKESQKESQKETVAT